MTDERIRKIEWELTENEDFFDDLMHPLDICNELLAEVKRLRKEITVHPE